MGGAGPSAFVGYDLSCPYISEVKTFFDLSAPRRARVAVRGVRRLRTAAALLLRPVLLLLAQRLLERVELFAERREVPAPERLLRALKRLARVLQFRRRPGPSARWRASSTLTTS